MSMRKLIETYERDGPNAEELEEWIRGYTDNFFSPAFPPDVPDTTLVS